MKSPKPAADLLQHPPGVVSPTYWESMSVWSLLAEHAVHAITDLAQVFLKLSDASLALFT